MFFWVLKNLNLIPIYQSSDKSDVKNYTDISVIAIIPEWFKSIIKELFATYNNYISLQQHCFYQSLSTATNLVIYKVHLSSLEVDLQADTIYTGLPKACIVVNCSCKNLSEIGVVSSFLKLITSYYLSHHFHQVIAQNCV